MSSRALPVFLESSNSPLWVWDLGFHCHFLKHSFMIRIFAYRLCTDEKTTACPAGLQGRQQIVYHEKGEVVSYVCMFSMMGGEI